MHLKRYWFGSAVCIGFCLLQVATGQQISDFKCKEYIKIRAYLALIEEKKLNRNASLIMTGQLALEAEYPHQAVLGYANKDAPKQIEFLCGGSLISEWYVLTAAHCGKPNTVRLGEHNLNSNTDNYQQDFEVAAFVRHPNYTSRQYYHDIGLVELAKEVQFDERIFPACLYTSSPFNKNSAVASGFGRTTNDNGLMSAKLMKVKLDLLDRAKCQKRFSFERKLENGLIPEQLCFGSQRGGRDTCNGDSGGPLQVFRGGYYIVGITSFGSSRCGVGFSAAVYTQVASYVTWIEQVVWPDGFESFYDYDYDY